MRYTPRERAALEKAIYVAAGRFPFGLPFDSPPHPQQGWKALRGTRHHEGLDFSAPIGTPVFAAGRGVVATSRDWGSGTGKWIVIEHDGDLTGFSTRYIHLDQRLVKVGDRVNQGDLIAYSGDTGRAAGPHLHFDIQADLAEHRDLASVLTRKFIGRTFRGKRNVPGEVLLPLADEDRPGLAEERLTGLASVASIYTEYPWMPPPGVPLVPYPVWIASAALGVVTAALAAYYIERHAAGPDS